MPNYGDYVQVGFNTGILCLLPTLLLVNFLGKLLDTSEIVFTFIDSMGTELHMYKKNTLLPINMAAVAIAIFMYLGYSLARIGMGNDFNILPLLLSVSILLLPAISAGALKLPAAFLQFASLFLFFGLGWISILFDVDLSFMLYATGIVPLLLLFRGVTVSINKRMVIAGVLTILLALKLISILWTTNYYLSPLAPEAYAIDHLHIDTLYLAGLTSIIKTYQITSTGLFGLVPIQYHAGSNYLFASFSQLCNLSPLQFYNFAFPVIFVPLFFQSFFYAVFSNLKRKPDAFKIITCLLILFFVVSGFVPNSVGYKYLLLSTLNNHFLSESYCISLILMFLFISLYSPFFITNKLSSRAGLNVFLILMIPVWFCAIGYAKISTAVILFVAFSYLIVRRRLILQKWILLAFGITISVLPYLLYSTVESNRSATFSIDLGSFYKYYVTGSIPLYFLLNFCFLMVMVLSYVLLFRRKVGGILRQAISGKYIVPETIVVAAVAGLMPGLLIEIEGGSALYFSDVQNWMSVIALAAIAPYLVYRYYDKLSKARTAIGILLVVVAIIVVREAVFRSFYHLVTQNIRIRTALIFGDDTSLSPVKKKSGRPTFMGRESLSGVADLLKACANPRESPLFNQQVAKLKLPILEELWSLPRVVKKKSVIYCEDPQELPSFKDCGEAFYLTAFTGIALINGLHWKPCFPSGEYAWRYYPESPVQMTKEMARTLSKEKGFSHLIVLNLRSGSYTIMDL